MTSNSLYMKSAVALAFFIMGLIVIITEPFSSSEERPIPVSMRGCYQIGDQTIHLNANSISFGSVKIRALLYTDNKGSFIDTSPRIKLVEGTGGIKFSLDRGMETTLRVDSEDLGQLIFYTKSGRKVVLTKSICEELDL